MRQLLTLLIGLGILSAAPLGAQDPIRVVPGWGVDTTAVSAWHAADRLEDIRQIYRRWAAYLRSGTRGFEPTEYWSSEEQARLENYDMTAGFAYQGMPATVLNIHPAPGETSRSYLVKTLFGTTSGPDDDIKPIALTRVHAVQEAGEWVFSGAHSRVTREWASETVGPITYVIEPGHSFDRGRAEAAVEFADSVASMFEVGSLEELTYFVAGTGDAIRRIMGVDWTVGGDTPGYANYANRMIFSGDPSVGENYRHELVHFALGTILVEGRTHPIVNEGIATWLGGSMGQDFPALMSDYSDFLRQNPDVTLDAVLAPGGPDLGTRPGGAMLSLMAYETGGVEGVLDLMHTGRTTAELRGGAEEIFEDDWSEISRDWRRRVLELDL